MHKKLIALFALIFMGFAMPSMALPSSWAYGPPYTHITGDRIAANMPVPFDTETDHATVGFIDFEITDYTPFTPSNFPREGVGVEDREETSYSGTHSLKITKNADSPQLGATLVLNPNVQPGDWYTFSCMIYAADITEGSPRIVIQTYSAEGIWIRERSVGSSIISNTDWYKLTALIEIPEEGARLRIMCYLPQATGGTAYYDDLTLKKMRLDPMDTVLLTPSYKGLIYGEGGMGDINMDIMVYDYNGVYSMTDMGFKSQIVDESDNIIMITETEDVTSKMSVSFSSKRLGYGEYYLQGILYEKQTETIISQKEWTIRKRSADYRPTVYLDEHNRLIKDGEPYFLMQMYNSNAYDDFIDDTVGTPIKTMTHYGMGWWLLRDQYTDMLQRMRDNGLQIRLTLLTFVFSNLSQEEARDLITEQADIRSLVEDIISAYCEDEVLQGYYLFDEADPVRYGEEIRWLNEICANADINRPTAGVTDKMHRYGIFTKMVDIIGTDPYPVMGREDDDIAKVGRYVKQLKTDFPNRPVYIVLQGFHWKVPGSLRAPSEEEMRNMMWQAFCEGAQGLEWYSYRAMKNDDEKPFSQWWQEAANLYSEAERFSPVLMSAEPAPHYQVEGGGEWLNILSKRYNGKSYIFSVNNTKQEDSAQIKLEGALMVKDALSGEVYTLDENGTFDVNYDTLDVKIFEIEQKSYPSPQAELKSLGFSNCAVSYIITYDEQGNAILNIPENVEVIRYGAQISPNARLYINGIRKELEGGIDISQLDRITVRVEGEDKNFFTEKTYFISGASSPSYLFCRNVN